ncbi:unnamed protein product [Paramecium octaurelia]|uniref:Uncharacterized protein n=1 Tax=Paramecium octaurelia TaxID=43137 RepID=A0A8S1S839_PAROT|nr:unnamed protein product [Paramecium octaurelia]CAD8137391.1 unnamed protein product [Paramecium octaurelia]
MSSKQEEPNHVRKSSRQKKMTENFKEMLQEIKEQKPSSKKSDQKQEKYQQKKIQEQKKGMSYNHILVYEYGFTTDWVDCIYPHDNGQTFDLQIQFCVLKPKKPALKKQKNEQTEEGIMSLIQNLLTNLSQNPEQIQRQNDSQIQRVQTTNEGIIVYHPYFKKIEYQSKKPQQTDRIETTPELEMLQQKFESIKKSFRPLILI